MSKEDYKSDDILLPRENYVLVFDPSGGVTIDLFNAFPESAEEKFISIMANGADVYINSGVAGTVIADPAAVAGPTRSGMIANGTERPFQVHLDSRFLAFKSLVACKVIVYLSSY